MPADLLQRIQPTLDLLYPPFLAVSLEGLAAARRRGADYWVTRGFSTYFEQTKLWRQGRLEPGPIVTHALAGQSSHNFGLAGDGARDTLPDAPKLQPGWRREDYLVLGEEMERLGLVWGGRFSNPDCPHWQWPGYVTARQLYPFRVLLDGYGQVEGLRRVWALLDEEVVTPEWQAANPRLSATLARLDFIPRAA